MSGAKNRKLRKFLARKDSPRSMRIRGYLLTIFSPPPIPQTLEWSDCESGSFREAGLSLGETFEVDVETGDIRPHKPA